MRPHPGLAMAWRDLNTAETPRERARRLTQLADANPDHHESRILLVEQALLAGDVIQARKAAELGVRVLSEAEWRALAGVGVVP